MAAMKSNLKRLAALEDTKYGVYVAGQEAAAARYKVLGTGTTREVRFAGPTNLDTAEMRRSVLSLHHARTAQYPLPKRPVRNTPPGFDRTPLRPTGITALGDRDYEVELTSPDGKTVSIMVRLKLSRLGEKELLTADMIGDPQIIARVYPPDLNRAVADFCAAVGASNL